MGKPLYSGFNFKGKVGHSRSGVLMASFKYLEIKDHQYANTP
jgi:hypothetical protein